LAAAELINAVASIAIASPMFWGAVPSPRTRAAEPGRTDAADAGRCRDVTAHAVSTRSEPACGGANATGASSLGLLAA
jgi:hypothetical protein